MREMLSRERDEAEKELNKEKKKYLEKENERKKKTEMKVSAEKKKEEQQTKLITLRQINHLRCGTSSDAMDIVIKENVKQPEVRAALCLRWILI